MVHPGRGSARISSRLGLVPWRRSPERPPARSGSQSGLHVHPLSARGRVGLEGVDDQVRRRARHLAELVGLGVVDGTLIGGDQGEVVWDGPPVGLVLTGRPGPLSAQVPVVCIGAQGTFRLPGDEDLIASLLASVAGPNSPTDPPTYPIVAVAGWEGGVGATTLAVALSRHIGACLVDACGGGVGVRRILPFHDEGITWADVDPREHSFPTSIIDHLPVCGGIRVLGADPRGGATSDDPRLGGVVAALSASTPVVVDAGRWDDRARAATRGQGTYGVPVVGALCLVGRGDEESALSLAGALGAWEPGVAHVLAHQLPASALLGSAGWIRGADEVEIRAPMWRFRQSRRGRGVRNLGQLWDLVGDTACASIGVIRQGSSTTRGSP